MTANETAPPPAHVGADECPFVDFGGGNKFRVLQVRRHEGLWISETIMMAGFEVQTHRHTGPEWSYTTSGAWKFKEYEQVGRAGSFVYQPAGSVHTLQCLENNTRTWTHMYGVVLNLDPAGNVVSVIDGPGSVEVYIALCEAQGLPRPHVLIE